MNNPFDELHDRHAAKGGKAYERFLLKARVAYHEAAHLVMAVRHGARVTSVEVTPGGGFVNCRYDDQPPYLRAEIAAAGLVADNYLGFDLPPVREKPPNAESDWGDLWRLCIHEPPSWGLEGIDPLQVLQSADKFLDEHWGLVEWVAFVLTRRSAAEAEPSAAWLRKIASYITQPAYLKADHPWVAGRAWDSALHLWNLGTTARELGTEAGLQPLRQSS